MILPFGAAARKGRKEMKLTQIRGISEKREKDLNKLNIFTAEDLVRFFPRDYLDLTQTVKISQCYHNDVVLLACRVASPPQAVYAGRRPFIKVWCDQGGERFPPSGSMRRTCRKT